MISRPAAPIAELFSGQPFTRIDVEVGNRTHSVELPQRYYDFGFIMAHFPAPSWKVRRLLPSRHLQPVMVVPGLALVSIAAFEYRDMEDLEPYNEVAVMVPVRHDPAINVPLLPLLFTEAYKDLGFYIHCLPVTTQQACDVGVGLWNFPKTVETITFMESPTTRECQWSRDGNVILTLEVRKGSPRTRAISYVAYPRKDDAIVRTLDQTRGQYFQTLFPGGARLRLGAHPLADELRKIGMIPLAFGRTYVPHAQSLLHGPWERLAA